MLTDRGRGGVLIECLCSLSFLLVSHKYSNSNAWIDITYSMHHKRLQMTCVSRGHSHDCPVKLFSIATRLDI